MRTGVGEDGSDDASDISRTNRRSLAPPERQFDAASLAHGSPGDGEEGFKEYRRPDGDDWQARPCKRLFAEPVLALLAAPSSVLDAHLGDGHLRHVDERVDTEFPDHCRHRHGRLKVP